MDQGVIRSFKSHYRKEMIRHILNNGDRDSYEKFHKTFNIKDAIYSLARVWDSVGFSTLKNSWSNFIPEHEENDAEQLISAEQGGIVNDIIGCAIDVSQEMSNDLTTNIVTDWINSDSGAPVCCNLTDDEIVEMVINPQVITPDEESEEEVEVIRKNSGVTVTEAIFSTRKVINFVEDRNLIPDPEVIQLYRLQDKLIKEKPKMQKQATLYHFFEK